MTNITLCGAGGKMGRTIQKCITDRDDCKIISGIDLNTESYADFPIFSAPCELPEKPDVIIDYSHPSCLKSLLEYSLTTGTPLVLATTGYSEEQISEIRKAAEQVPVFFSWNMSLGINLLMDLVCRAAKILESNFDIEILEKHHNQKLDAPSGTALALADAISDAVSYAPEYTYDRHSVRQKRGKNEIGIHSVRGGTIVGEHTVIFAGNDETIEFTHKAASKEVFAVGAVRAAEFLKDKKSGLYSMKDLIAE